MTDGKKKIVFYLETDWPVGGSQIMFISLGSYIADNYDNYDVYYINNSHANLESIYGSPNLKMIDVEKCNPEDFTGSTIITPYNYTFEMMVRFGKVRDIKIVFFYYHQEIMTWLNNEMRTPVIDMKPFLKLIEEKDAYCFMDGSCFKSITDRLGDIAFKRRYLPVPIKLKPELPAVELIDNGKINVGWLGRLDADKVYSVINLADNLLAMDSVKKIDFHIIGDGNSKDLIEIDSYSPQIRFIFTSNLYGDVRDAYIRDNIDIMVAMGMSATDSSQLKVPVVFPIVSPERFYDDKFIYLFDTNEYAIGWEPDEINSSGCVIHTIEEIVEDIYVHKKKEEYAKRCADTAVKLFSPQNCVNHLLPLLNDTRLTIGDCWECRPIKRLMKRYNMYARMSKDPSFKKFHMVSRELRIDTIRDQGIIETLKKYIGVAISLVREDDGNGNGGEKDD